MVGLIDIAPGVRPLRSREHRSRYAASLQKAWLTFSDDSRAPEADDGPGGRWMN